MSEQDDDRAWVYMTNAVQTSAGAAIGAKLLPRDEAASLVARRVAIWGQAPPRGW